MRKKLHPLTNLDTYRLAHQLRSSLLAALDERDQALSRAGVLQSQAVANAATLSTQALEVRRNYQMSWPQFMREVNQRDNLKEQGSTQIGALMERVRGEWTTFGDPHASLSE